MKIFRLTVALCAMTLCFASCSDDDSKEADDFGFNYVHNPNAPKKRVTKVITEQNDDREIVSFEYNENNVSSVTVTNVVISTNYQESTTSNFKYRENQLTINDNKSYDINEDCYLLNGPNYKRVNYTTDGYLQSIDQRNGANNYFQYDGNKNLLSYGVTLITEINEYTDIPNIGNLYLVNTVPYIQGSELMWSGLLGKSSPYLPKEVIEYDQRYPTTHTRYNYAYKFDNDGYVTHIRIMPKNVAVNHVETDVAGGNYMMTFTYETYN